MLGNVVLSNEQSINQTAGLQTNYDWQILFHGLRFDQLSGTYVAPGAHNFNSYSNTALQPDYSQYNQGNAYVANWTWTDYAAYGYTKAASPVLKISVVAVATVGTFAGQPEAIIAGAGLYVEFTTAAGVVAATQHLYNGTAGIGDALAFLPVVSSGIGSLGEPGCFVAGTDVLEENPQGSTAAPVDTQIQNVKVGDEVLTRDQNSPNAPAEIPASVCRVPAMSNRPQLPLLLRVNVPAVLPTPSNHTFSMTPPPLSGQRPAGIQESAGAVPAHGV